MPIITGIKQQKNKNRINVYLDDKFGFGIDLDNFVLLHLKVDQELTDEEVAGIVKKAEFQKTYDKLLRFAMVRPRSEKEVTDYFRRKKVHESMHEKMLEKLKHLELLDDAKFAIWWVGQRIQFKSKSKRELEFELRNKGIAKEIITKILEGAEIDETKAAKRLLQKYSYKWDRLDKRAARLKKSEFLARKGFSWDIIGQITKIDPDG